MRGRRRIKSHALEETRDTISSRIPRASYSSNSNSTPSFDDVHFLQQTIGNQAVQRLFKSGVIQAKLRIGQPNDIYEQEADRVAGKVMQMPEPVVQAKPTWASSNPPCGEEEAVQPKPLRLTPLVQRQSESKDEEDESVAAKEIPGQTPRVSAGLESSIQSLKGSGQSLPEPARAFFEPRFGYDFSKVKVHTDGSSVKMNKEVNAQAFTYGRDIYFGAGKYSPGAPSGRKLLAHELTHVVQQDSFGSRAATIQRDKESSTTFSIATATWDHAIREARRLLQTRSAANRATALSYYKQLIIRVAQNVRVPAPLTARTPTEPDIRWSWNTNVDWSATTDPNRVDNYPSNYWQWLQFNPSVFDHSQTYAESIIAHELDHAAHAKALYDAWTAAGTGGNWDAYYQQHYRRWTEPAIRVSSPGLVGALAGLPSRIQPSVIEFRAYVRQLTNYFHRLSRTDHDLMPKGVVLFYPLGIQNVPTETVRDRALDLAAARQELLQYFARPPVQDSTQRTYVRLLLAQGFKSALRLFRPAADQPQMTQDFSTIMQFTTSEDMLRTARQNYRPQP